MIPPATVYSPFSDIAFVSGTILVTRG